MEYQWNDICRWDLSTKGSQLYTIVYQLISNSHMYVLPQLNQKQCVFPKQKKPVKMAKYVYMNFQSSMS